MFPDSLPVVLADGDLHHLFYCIVTTLFPRPKSVFTMHSRLGTFVADVTETIEAEVPFEAFLKFLSMDCGFFGF